MAKIVLRMEPYDPDAKDADGDGIVQERTPWERPAGAKLLDKFGNQIAKGAVQNARPDGIQVIDKDGNKIDYVPSYAGRVPEKRGQGPKSPLSDHGAMSLRERGFLTVGEIVSSANTPPEPAPPEQVSDDQRVDVVLKTLSDDKVDFKGQEKKLRDFLGAAAAAIESYDPQASDEEKVDALWFAARAFLWKEKVQELLGKDSKGNVDIQQMLDSIYNAADGGGTAPHNLLDKIYERGGTPMLAAALIDFTKDMERSDLARIAQRFQMRFNDKEIEVQDETIDPEWQSSALKAIFDSWTAAQETKVSDPDSLDKMSDLVEQRITSTPIGAIEQILERPEARGNPRLVSEVNMDYNSIERFPLAEKHLHENLGDVSDVPPEAWVTAMFDSHLVDDAGRSVDIVEVLTEVDFYENLYGADEYEMENNRFKFSLIKNDSGGDFGVWAVWAVTDKETGNQYFIKTSQYGLHDAMLEKVADDIQAILGFTDRRDTHLANPQGSPVRINYWADGYGSTGRWVVTPHVAELQQPAVPRDQVREWADVESLWRQEGMDPTIDMDLMRQIARLAIMDYVMDNTDRHAGNLLVYADGSTTRLVPIDHGLAFGGRGGAFDGDRTNWGESEWDAMANERGRLDPQRWGEGTYNRLQVVLANNRKTKDLQSDDAAGRERTRVMLEAAQAAIVELDSVDVEELFSPERFQRQGITLSSSELQHLAAMKKMFTMRMETLKTEDIGMTVEDLLVL